MIDVLFFASLREKMGTEKIQIESRDLTSVGDVIMHLSQLNDEWQHTLRNNTLLMAVNQDMASLSSAVKDCDEIAFFPPVTGG